MRSQRSPYRTIRSVTGPAKAFCAPLLGFAGLFLTGCSSLTTPPETERTAPAPPPVVTAALPTPPSPPPPLAPPPEERIAASHILVAYKGGQNAAEKITRTKEQAKKRAEEAMKKAKGGEDFSALAKQYSDDPGSGPRGGDLGKFSRATMVKPFSDAAFLLKVGEVSGIVESAFGFHVIKRTQ